MWKVIDGLFERFPKRTRIQDDVEMDGAEVSNDADLAEHVLAEVAEDEFAFVATPATLVVRPILSDREFFRRLYDVAILKQPFLVLLVCLYNKNGIIITQ